MLPLALPAFVPSTKGTGAETLLGAHHEQDVHMVLVVPVENAAGWFHDLSVAGPLELWRSGPASGVICQLFHVLENPSHESSGRVGIVQRDVVGDGVEICQCRLSPNYFSHRAMRRLA